MIVFLHVYNLKAINFILQYFRDVSEAIMAKSGRSDDHRCTEYIDQYTDYNNLYAD